MQYNEIYEICQPIIDWLKEHYPHNHKIVIETTGANLIEDGKLVVLDKDLKSNMFQKPFIPEGYEREIQEFLNMDVSQIEDDVIRFGFETIQKAFGQGKQMKLKKNGSEE